MLHEGELIQLFEHTEFESKILVIFLLTDYFSESTSKVMGGR